MTAILDDLRSSARLVRRWPGTVALALLSLTLGIGANAAVSASSTPSSSARCQWQTRRTLVDVSETSATELCAGCGVGTSYPTYLDWKQTTTSFAAILMSSPAGVALLMASMGTFGVIAYSVSQRTREIGVRVALGATPQQVQRMVVRGGAILTAAGLAVGLPGAWLSTRALEGILAGTSPTDPTVFAVVSAILATVALAAIWIPARRAAKVDPLVALSES